MLFVLPEVVDLAAQEARRRDAVLGAGNVERFLEKHRVAWIGLEDDSAGRIVRANPIQRFRRGEVLEPKVGIEHRNGLLTASLRLSALYASALTQTEGAGNLLSLSRME